MPTDIASLCTPASTALVVFECQQALLEPGGPLPGLAAAVESGGVVDHIASLQAAARRRGVPVFFCTVHRRPDGVGSAMNTPLEQRLRARSGDAPTVPDLGDIVDRLAPREGEVVVDRRHGLTGFHESGLDPMLRSRGIRTIVLCGVSINLGILGTAIEAVNRGYFVVVPADCVAGDPPEYAEQALRYSVRNVAFVSDSDSVARAWEGLSPAARLWPLEGRSACARPRNENGAVAARICERYGAVRSLIAADCVQATRRR